mgnify:CR=1 FL=1
MGLWSRDLGVKSVKVVVTKGADMKRRIAMGLAAVIAVFATENVVDMLVSRYLTMSTEVIVWLILAALCSFIVYEVGEDRGDW